MVPQFFLTESGHFLPAIPQLEPDFIVVSFHSEGLGLFDTRYDCNMPDCIKNAYFFAGYLQRAGRFVSMEFIYESKMNRK